MSCALTRTRFPILIALHRSLNHAANAKFLTDPLLDNIYQLVGRHDVEMQAS
jgi:hypothetical protein